MPTTRFEPGPGDDSPSTITLRYLYLIQIRKHAPRVLEELSRRPWRYFSRACVDVYVQHHLCDPDHGNQAWLSEILADPDSDFWRNPRSAVYYKRIHPYAGRFYLSLADWLCGFFLNTRWGYEAVLNTFSWWHQSPEMLKQLHWAPLSGPVNEVSTDEERTLRFEHQLKVSPVKNMRLIKEELDKAYKDRRDQFLREMEGLLTERGYVKGPSKIEEDHYKWLVLYNCLHWSFSEIAKHEEKSLKTIRDGVQIAAARIGIVIRPSGRPGRPKKSS